MSGAESTPIRNTHYPEVRVHDEDAADDRRKLVRSLKMPDKPVEGAAGGSRFAWIVCGLLALTSIALGYVALRRTPVTAPPPAVAATPTASTEPAEQDRLAVSGGIVLESKGYLVPAHQILVSPKVSGMIQRLRIQEGQQVVKGEVIAELEDTEYSAEYGRTKAMCDVAWQRLLEGYMGSRTEEIAQAKSEWAEADAQVPQLKAEWERNKGLRDRNAISQLDFEVSESKYWAMVRRAEKLKSSLALMIEGPRIERISVARADVCQAEADRAKARWRLDNCTIRAPISGTILKKNAEEGNIVNPIAFNGSFSVCEMADLSDLEVDLSIQERDIARIFVGQKCKVTAEAYPKRTWDGYVSRLMPIADRAKGAISVRVKVAVPHNEEGVYLKPEMAVNVAFFEKSETTEKTPAAPATVESK